MSPTLVTGQHSSPTAAGAHAHVVLALPKKQFTKNSLHLLLELFHNKPFIINELNKFYSSNSYLAYLLSPTKFPSEANIVLAARPSARSQTSGCLGSVSFFKLNLKKTLD
jgi:hypothetical protein